MSKIINHANYVDHHTLADPRTGEVIGLAVGEFFTQPSQTVPGMTLSLHELISKYIRGEQVVSFVPTYSDDEDIPDNLERMSEIERKEYAAIIREGIADYQRTRRAVPPPVPVTDSSSDLVQDADMAES